MSFIYKKICQSIIIGILAMIVMAGCSGSKGGNGPSLIYSISGTVTGAVSQGVTVSLSGAGSGTTTTTASGSYSFGNLANGTYNVAPSISGYSFSPVSKAVTINGADITTVNFTATANNAPIYSISGQVTFSGSGLTNVTMTLSGAGSGTTATTASGIYIFSGLVNGGYTVAPAKLGYAFSPASKPVTVNSANMTGVDFTAESTMPNPPTGLTAAAGTQVAKLTWKPSTGATAYNIYFAQSGAFAYTGTTTAAGFTVTDLISGALSYFTITAVNGAGESAGSISASTTPLGPLTYAVGSSPLGIAIDASGNIWIANLGSPSVQGNTISEITGVGTGSVVTQTITGVLGGPYGIAIDRAGNAWVTKGFANTVQVVNAAGSALTSYTTGVNTDTYGVMIDDAGNVWVVNYNDGAVIKVIPTTGAEQTYSSIGSSPWGITMDGAGNVWVSDFNGQAAIELTPTMAVKQTYKIGGRALGISIDPSGNVWVGNYDGTTISEITTSGTVNTYDVGSFLPAGIAIDALGNVWVASRGSSNIMELNPSGKLLATYPLVSAISSEGIAIDASGNIWVTNPNNDMVTELVNVTTGPQYFPCSHFTDTTCPQFQSGGGE